jgi:hypothetical protein
VQNNSIISELVKNYEEKKYEITNKIFNYKIFKKIFDLI